MTAELILANARIVLEDGVVHGHLLIRDGRIAAVDTGHSPPAGAEDLDGDLLLPGLVELHTDNLEKHLKPRPGVQWPALPALVAHDAQLAASGITTVLDAMRIGDRALSAGLTERIGETADCIRAAQAENLFRAEHFLHLRCEVGEPQAAEAFEEFSAHPLLRLVSLMDHAPGQRQFTDIGQWKLYYGGTYGLSDDELERMRIEQQARSARYANVNRRRIASLCRVRGTGMASHDDATEAHVAEAVELGLTMAEFPTTEAAAIAAKREGLATIAGAPNLVRGKSHSGNVAAAELASKGLLDVLSSDYMPISLLHAVFVLHDRLDMPLPQAVATVSRTPASLVGLSDRGAIRPGLRADLIQVRQAADAPIVRRVWREGSRVV